MKKAVELALNIQTFINLVGYGYPNVRELNEVVDFNDPKIGWVKGTSARWRAGLGQRRLQPARDDGAWREVHRRGHGRPPGQARDRRSGSRSPPSPSTTTSRRLTFCRQFIRAVFSWPTKQPLVKLTPFSSAALHSSQSRSPSSARPSQTPSRSRCSSQPCRRVARPEPSQRRPSSGQAGVGYALIAVRRPMDRQAVVALDRRSAGAGDRSTSRLIRSSAACRLAVEQQVVAIGPHQEIEQAFALRRQQSGPDRKRAGDILGHQSLQEFADIFAGQADEGSVGKGGRGHEGLAKEPA